MNTARPTALESLRHSLRWRLPLIITALVSAVVVLVVGLAYREIARADVLLATGRARGAVNQIANTLAQSAQQRMVEGQLFVARVPSLHECLQTRAEPVCDAARTALASLPAPVPQVSELWSGDGALVLTVASDATADRLLPSGGPPTSEGVQPLRVRDGVLLSEAVWPISPVQTDANHQPTSGFVVVRRPVSTPAQTRNLLNQLLGDHGSITVGNQDGDVWTNLTTPVPAPAIDLKRTGPQTYTDASGTLRVGALSPIPRTPWLAWAEFPQQDIVAPARQLLLRMSFLAVLFVSGACAVAVVISRRITIPLGQLTDMSEVVAQGDYSPRINSTRFDEIGRLGRAFDVMVGGVQKAYQNLEQTVQERTVGLQTVRRELEIRVDELKEAREEQERFFALSPDLLCIADVHGRLVKVNDAWERLLGWSAGELTAAPFIEFVHADDIEATIAATSALAQEHNSVRLENRYRRKDGSYVWLSWRAVSSPERGVVYAAARDITERRRVARELEQHIEEIAAVNRELEAFSYSVSHDLRAPLRHITGFGALLGRSAVPKLDEQERRWLSVINEAALRMGRLIDDLLAFSRVGRTAVSKDRVKLAAIVRDAWREAAPDDGEGRQISCEIGDLPDVIGDAALLRLAFVNLLGNAVKYTRDVAAPRIEVAAETAASGETVISIRDNGVGFDMQYADKLFGVFQRLHSSDQFEGTGIGLANVRRIVHRHGGRTWAKGAVGQGATFFVALPIALTEAA
jgi:PAS domain S-box-containing protein